MSLDGDGTKIQMERKRTWEDRSNAGRHGDRPVQPKLKRQEWADWKKRTWEESAERGPAQGPSPTSEAEATGMGGLGEAYVGGSGAEPGNLRLTCGGRGRSP